MVRAPVVTPKSPAAETVALTVNAADGAGVAVIVKLTLSPSLPPAELVMFTCGVTTLGSSFLIVTVCEPGLPLEYEPYSLVVFGAIVKVTQPSASYLSLERVGSDTVVLAPEMVTSLNWNLSRPGSMNCCCALVVSR